MFTLSAVGRHSLPNAWLCQVGIGFSVGLLSLWIVVLSGSGICDLRHDLQHMIGAEMS